LWQHKRLHAEIILKADSSELGDKWLDSQIGEAFGISKRTVELIRERLVQEGLETTLNWAKPIRVKSRNIYREKEAHLMALACCDALDGRSRRTLRLFGQHRVLHNQPCYTNYPSNCIKLKPYPAAISINPGEPEKEKAAFLSKSGKKGGVLLKQA